MADIDLTALYNLLDVSHVGNLTARNELLKQNFSPFQKQVKEIFESWFPNSKAISDEDIINCGFKIHQRKDIKIKVKYSLVCLLKSSNRVFENTQRFWDGQNLPFYEKELLLLKEMAFEASIFLDSSSKLLAKSGFTLTGFKSRVLSSQNAFDASEYFLRHFFF